MSDETRFAVLIDAENISPKYIQIIFDEVSNYGISTYRRIYGDWTSTRNNRWKEVLLDNSITPIQQYSYTEGKNSSDSAMIIDAMDILYTLSVDGYVLVSSDSDFTRLASRLRESGMTVIGMGESKTPNAFISACNTFKYLDILFASHAEAEEEEGHEHDAGKAPNVKSLHVAEGSVSKPHVKSIGKANETVTGDSGEHKDVALLSRKEWKKGRNNDSKSCGDAKKTASATCRARKRPFWPYEKHCAALCVKTPMRRIGSPWLTWAINSPSASRTLTYVTMAIRSLSPSLNPFMNLRWPIVPSLNLAISSFLCA